MEKKYTIVVACHKPYWKSDDSIYQYVEAGTALHTHPISDMLHDNTGRHISEKNETFCELTALYWAWKNLDSDYLGLCHYRRYFAGKPFGPRQARILAGDDLRSILETTAVVLPRKRRYWIETNYSQYIHAHHEQDLDTTREILERVAPEYLPAFDRSMAQISGHRFNMFIMRKDLADAYCGWLFDILFRLEEKLDISGYDAKDRRVFGYVAERLIDTWLNTNHISYRELPVVNLEKQNWLKKGGMFLVRKWRGGER